MLARFSCPSLLIIAHSISSLCVVFPVSLSDELICAQGLGAACIIARVRRIPELLIHAAAQALAASLNVEERAADLLYPQLNRIRDVSIEVARGVIRAAQKAVRLGACPLPKA